MIGYHGPRATFARDLGPPDRHDMAGLAVAAFGTSREAADDAMELALRPRDYSAFRLFGPDQMCGPAVPSAAPLPPASEPAPVLSGAPASNEWMRDVLGVSAIELALGLP